MVRNREECLEILDTLVERLLESGAALPESCRTALHLATTDVLDKPDVVYVPNYKITQLLTDVVNIAASVTSEGWLLPEEAEAQLKSLIGPESHLVRHFLSQAGMERARYEPIMLAERYHSPLSERNAILSLRLKRMLAARQTYDPLPNSYLRSVRMAGHRAIHAECFSIFRIGPMLQFFDDMIKQANVIAESTYDEFEGLSGLAHVLREDGNLWKLYKHKAPRFAAKEGDPLLTNVFTTRANMVYVPDTPGAPTLH